MNKILSKKLIKILFISLIATTFLLINSRISKADEKDLILIVDTSLSMAGYGKGSTNILPEVKKSLPQFIDQLEEDDSFTLITFDTDIKKYPTIYIDDERNKESLIQYIQNIEARGAWTYTSKMMKTAFQKAQELESEDEDRQRVLVIVTDTLDDPPPGNRKDRLNIKEIGENYKDKDWFIFFVNFGEAVKTNPKLAKMQEDLTKDVTKYTKVIEAKIPSGETAGTEGGKAGKTPAESIKKTIEKDLSENIQQMSDKKVGIETSGAFPYMALIIALVIIAIVLAAIYFLKSYSKLKVTGKLEYWDHTLLSPYFESFDLTKQNVKEILIGTKNSFNLTIRDIDISNPFKITAIKVNGEAKSTLQAGKGYSIEYVNRDSEGYLKNGDIFKVANYSFKYTSA